MFDMIMNLNKIFLIPAFLVIVLIIGYFVFPIEMIEPPIHVYGDGDPVQIQNGVSIMPEAIDMLSSTQLQELVEDLVDEYGEDANIIIYEVGR